MVVVGLDDEVLVILLLVFRIWLVLRNVFQLTLFDFLLENKFFVLIIGGSIRLVVILFTLLLWRGLLLLWSCWLNLLLLFLGGLLGVRSLLLLGGLLLLGHFLWLRLRSAILVLGL